MQQKRRLHRNLAIFSPTFEIILCNVGYIYSHELTYISAKNCFMPLGQSSGN